jgi:hypothetical protein
MANVILWQSPAKSLQTCHTMIPPNAIHRISVVPPLYNHVSFGHNIDTDYQLPRLYVN